jgi:regulatory protein
MENTQDTIKPYIQLTLGYLAIRIRSKQELVQYLESKTKDSNIIESVLNYLDTHNLINDEEFACAWAESRLRKNKGDLYIKQELHQKGIPNSIIQLILKNIDNESWNMSIKNCLSKYENKWKSLKGYAQKSMIYAILGQRGYSAPRIDAFLKNRVE